VTRALGTLDHLVYAVPHLQEAIDDLERRLGVRSVFGGQHPGRGTHNALLGLGPGQYLEIIAPDPCQPQPPVSPWFTQNRIDSPRLLTWAAKATHLEGLVAEAKSNGLELGEVRDGGRKRPDGTELKWRLTSTPTGVCDWLVPFFIDWGDSPHPSESAPVGATLTLLEAEHPDPAWVLKALRIAGVEMEVRSGPAPKLLATLQTPKGVVVLS